MVSHLTLLSCVAIGSVQGSFRSLGERQPVSPCKELSFLLLVQFSGRYLIQVPVMCSHHVFENVSGVHLSRTRCKQFSAYPFENRTHVRGGSVLKLSRFQLASRTQISCMWSRRRCSIYALGRFRAVGITEANAHKHGPTKCELRWSISSLPSSGCKIEIILQRSQYNVFSLLFSKIRHKLQSGIGECEFKVLAHCAYRTPRPLLWVDLLHSESLIVKSAFMIRLRGWCNNIICDVGAGSFTIANLIDRALDLQPWMASVTLDWSSWASTFT